MNVDTFTVVNTRGRTSTETINDALLYKKYEKALRGVYSRKSLTGKLRITATPTLGHVRFTMQQL